MGDDDRAAEIALANAVNDQNQDGTTTTTADTTDTTNNGANPWDELGTFDDVKKKLEFARNWERRAKDGEKKLAAIEDAKKTEQQRLADQLTATQQELDGYKLREIRMNAAREAGLDVDMAQFLTESEPESALTQAKLLAKKLEPRKADLKQGARKPTTQPEDINAWIRRQAGYPSTPS